jgi:hypothetical protein
MGCWKKKNQKKKYEASCAPHEGFGAAMGTRKIIGMRNSKRTILEKERHRKTTVILE